MRLKVDRPLFVLTVGKRRLMLLFELEDEVGLSSPFKVVGVMAEVDLLRLTSPFVLFVSTNILGGMRKFCCCCTL